MANETKQVGRAVGGDVNKLLQKKVEMIAQVRSLQAEIWRLNTQLQSAGADINQISCW